MMIKIEIKRTLGSETVFHHLKIEDGSKIILAGLRQCFWKTTGDKSGMVKDIKKRKS